MIGFVRKENDRRNSGLLETNSLKADTDIVPNTNMTLDGQQDFLALPEALLATGNGE